MNTQPSCSSPEFDTLFEMHFAALAELDTLREQNNRLMALNEKLIEQNGRWAEKFHVAKQAALAGQAQLQTHIAQLQSLLTVHILENNTLREIYENIISNTLNDENIITNALNDENVVQSALNDENIVPSALNGNHTNERKINSNVVGRQINKKRKTRPAALTEEEIAAITELEDKWKSKHRFYRRTNWTATLPPTPECDEEDEEESDDEDIN